jgi:hypothetical protein
MINAKSSKTSSTFVCNEKKVGWMKEFFIASVDLEL